MKLKLAAVSILTSAIVIPYSAIAGGHSVEKFMEADTNKDGLVSKEEFTLKYQKKFTKMDGDSDSNVSADEYRAYMDTKLQKRQKEKFNKIDTDGNGMISPEEMSTYSKQKKHKH